MLIIALLLMILTVFAINPALNRDITTKLTQEGKVFPYTTVQHMYPINEEQRPIYIFIHICTQGEHWRSILDKQLKTIVDSGLYGKCHTIWYGCSCQSCERLLADYFKPYKKVRPLHRAMCSNQKSYENQTINAMVRFSQNLTHIADCLYIHTKGTSAKSKAQHYWRDYMMYWMVERHNIALDLLHRDFFTVGTLYYKYPCIVMGFNRIYAGNFFWASSDYLKTLPHIHNISNRFLAEQLLFKKYVKGKHASITATNFLSIYFPFTTGLYKDHVKAIPLTNDKLRILVI